MRIRSFTKWIILAGLVAGGYYGYMHGGSFITKKVEKIASDAIGVRVNVGRIDVSLKEKKVSVEGITVANVPGYSQPYIVRAKGIDIGLNTASRELIDFNNIRLRGSEVFVEVTEKGINVNDLKKRINAKKGKGTKAEDQVRVIIERMVIEASTIHPSIALLGGKIDSITLPPLNFNGIGKGGAVTAGEAVKQIMAHYVASAEQAVQRAGLLSPVKDVEKKLKGVTDKLNVKGLF